MFLSVMTIGHTNLSHYTDLDSQQQRLQSCIYATIETESFSHSNQKLLHIGGQVRGRFL